MRAASRSLSAEADLRGGDAVVLVQHGHRLHRQQPGDRGARVEVAAALLGVGVGDEDLARGQPDGAERLGPGAGQRDLADGGGGLAVLELQRTRRQAEHAPAERDGAGGDDHHLGAARLQRGRGRRPARRARRGRTPSASTSSDEPTLTTMRRKSARRGVEIIGRCLAQGRRGARILPNGAATPRRRGARASALLERSYLHVGDGGVAAPLRPERAAALPASRCGPPPAPACPSGCAPREGTAWRTPDLWRVERFSPSKAISSTRPASRAVRDLAHWAETRNRIVAHETIELRQLLVGEAEIGLADGHQRLALRVRPPDARTCSPE